MQRFILARLVQSLLTIVGISVIVFALTRLSGDVLSLFLPPEADAKVRAEIRRELGLDRHIAVQYLVFLRNAAQGDLGDSIVEHGPALPKVLSKLPATLELGLSAMAIALLVAVPVGVFSAVRPDSLIDYLGRLLAMTGQAMPTFWVGLLLMLFFGVRLQLLPVAGRGGLDHLILPAVTLGWYSTAAIMRMTRSSMLEILDSDFIKMSRIKGTPERFVIWKHGLRSAAVPIITLSALQLALLISGTVVTETVFAWPGVGRLAVEAIFKRDYPVVQAAVLVISVIYISVNLLVDVLYAYVDPRIRFH